MCGLVSIGLSNSEYQLVAFVLWFVGGNSSSESSQRVAQIRQSPSLVPSGYTRYKTGSELCGSRK